MQCGITNWSDSCTSVRVLCPIHECSTLVTGQIPCEGPFQTQKRTVFYRFSVHNVPLPIMTIAYTEELWPEGWDNVMSLCVHCCNVYVSVWDPFSKSTYWLCVFVIVRCACFGTHLTRIGWHYCQPFWFVCVLHVRLTIAMCICLCILMCMCSAAPHTAVWDPSPFVNKHIGLRKPQVLSISSTIECHISQLMHIV